jgi:hypothetical protein
MLIVWLIREFKALLCPNYLGTNLIVCWVLRLFAFGEWVSALSAVDGCVLDNRGFDG